MNSLNQTLQARVMHPKCRGQWTEQDAAEKQLGLLKVGNGEGKVYWLLDMASKKIDEAKFLSFGKLESLPILDFFSEYAKGKNFEEVCKISSEELRIEFGKEVIQGISFDFIQDIQQKAHIAFKDVKVPPKPEKKDYRRKDKEDMDETDLNWLPLSAPMKISKLESLLRKTIVERSSYELEDVSIYHIAKDVEVTLSFADKVPLEERSTFAKFFEEACKGELHPLLIVESK